MECLQLSITLSHDLHWFFTPGGCGDFSSWHWKLGVRLGHLISQGVAGVGRRGSSAAKIILPILSTTTHHCRTRMFCLRLSYQSRSDLSCMSPSVGLHSVQPDLRQLSAMVALEFCYNFGVVARGYMYSSLPSTLS